MSNFRSLFAIHSIKAALLKMSTDSGMITDVKNMSDVRYFSNDNTKSTKTTESTKTIQVTVTAPVFDATSVTQASYINAIIEPADENSVAYKAKVKTMRIPCTIELKCRTICTNLLEAMNVQEYLIDTFVFPKYYDFDFDGVLHRGLFALTTMPSFENKEITFTEDATANIELDYTITMSVQYYAKLRSSNNNVAPTFSVVDELYDLNLQAIPANQNIITTTVQTIDALSDMPNDINVEHQITTEYNTPSAQ